MSRKMNPIYTRYVTTVVILLMLVSGLAQIFQIGNTPQATDESSDEPETPEEPQTETPTEADIFVARLELSDGRVMSGDPVNVSVTLRNDGDLGGVFDLSVLVNGEAEVDREVTVAGGAVETLEFEVLRQERGRYTVRVNNDIRSFEVVYADLVIIGLDVTPKVVGPEEPVQVSVHVENPNPVEVSRPITVSVDAWEGLVMATVPGWGNAVAGFNVSRDTPRSYIISAGGYEVSFTVASPRPGENTTDGETPQPEPP